jgi:Na+-transporting NADH:ubiquinone oxidoreductase subunit F
MLEIGLGVAFFTAIVVFLSALILLARGWLVPSGDIQLTINDERKVNVPVGAKLLAALSGVGLYLPSGCGGKGTCGQCRCQVLAGGGDLLPTEAALLSHREAGQQVRLACQVAVREDMTVRVPDEVFGVRKWSCKVRSNHNVATYIKELVVELPPGDPVDFKAGGYVQIECPAFQASFKDFDIDDRFRAEWDRYNLWRYQAGTDTPTTRAYSMANYPLEKDILMLNVRIATPPPGKDVPPGVVSSYIFSLRPGDQVTVAGPYGEFFVRDTNAEMVFVGGGAGMAPMRSHIFDQLKRVGTTRKMSFWYGARSQREIFYQADFERLAAEHENFQWHVALSELRADEQWSGPRGFIHDVLYQQFLKNHAAPEECDYYLCGPPLMIAAVTKMLDDLGVERESILFDDFGG